MSSLGASIPRWLSSVALTAATLVLGGCAGGAWSASATPVYGHPRLKSEPYINYPDNGEEYFDMGSLSIVPPRSGSRTACAVTAPERTSTCSRIAVRTC